MAKATLRGFSPELLRNMRARFGLTQGELATATGVSVSSIRHWENGVHAPDLAVARRVAAAVGVAVADLLELDTEDCLLADLRLRRGWYQTEVAQQLQCSPATIRAWERAERSPSHEQVAALARVYGVTPAEVAAAATRTQSARQHHVRGKIKQHSLTNEGSNVSSS